MNDEVEVYRPDWLAAIEPAYELANRLSRAQEFVPEGFRGRPEAIMAAILTGLELGVPPLWALRNVSVIKGRVTLSAEGMRAVVLRAGHELWQVSADDSAVVMAGRRRGDTRDPLEVEWTLNRATRAGLTSNPAWRSYPRAMLTARATSELCRVLFADVIAGIDTNDDLVDGTAPVDGPVSVRRRRTPRQSVTAIDTGDEGGDALPPAQSPPSTSESGDGKTQATRPAVDADSPPDLPPFDDLLDPPPDDDAERAAVELVGRLFDEGTPPKGGEAGVPSPQGATVVDDDERRVRARMFAQLRDALPDMATGQRERYRHALIALVTRRRAIPTVHFGDTDLAERTELASLIADLRARRLEYATEDDGTVTFTSAHRRALIMGVPDAPSVVVEDR